MPHATQVYEIHLGDFYFYIYFFDDGFLPKYTLHPESLSVLHSALNCFSKSGSKWLEMASLIDGISRNIQDIDQSFYTSTVYAELILEVLMSR